jgi:hypothetical protein
VSFSSAGNSSSREVRHTVDNGTVVPRCLEGGGQADRVGYVEHLEDDIGARGDDGLGVGGVIGGADLGNGGPFIDDVRAGGLETARRVIKGGDAGNDVLRDEGHP